jgi:long-chain acyl-CoA synthetase
MQPTRMFDFLDIQLSQNPKTNCLSYKENGEWKSISTATVQQQATQLAAAMLSLGIGGLNDDIEKTDKVAIVSRNRPEWILLDLACQYINVILCPIYPTTNVKELEFIFNDAEIKYAFISDQVIADKIDAVKNTVPSLRNTYSFDELPNFEFWHQLLDRSNADWVEKVAALKQQIKPDSCATIIYTSGTTGTPKGVMLSHKNIVTNVINACESFPFENSPNGKSLSFLPLNHIFERMVSYIYIRSAISIYYAENMDTIGENLKEVQPSLFSTVPRLLEKTYEKIMAKAAELSPLKKKLFYWALSLANEYQEGNKGSVIYKAKLAIANKLVFSKWREALGNNLEFIITGGAAAQVRLIRIFTAAKIPIFEGYGPTENSPVISVNRKEPGGVKFGSVGPVIKGQEVKLMEDGEICVKGPSVMLGYYKRPDLTNETIIDGWLHTGDIGVFEGKFLKITDRKKELFKTSGGKYVAPQPIENKLKESAMVEQVMVVGAEQKFVGALIVPSILELTNWCKAQQLPYDEPATMVRQKEVLQLFKDIVQRNNADFNQVEQIKKFEILPYEWTIDGGELTPTLKLKRKVIMEKYKDAIDRIYG